MSGILNQLNKLCSDLASEKLQLRQKATEQIHQLLTANKADIVKVLRVKNSSNGFSLATLFKNAVEAVLKHASKLDDSTDSKNCQAMRNKNYLYSSLLNQIVEINLEGDSAFLSKSTILDAFIEGWNLRIAVKYFGSTFLNLLDRGIYKCEEFIRQLRVNDFSSILSHLYEVNVHNDEVLRFAVLKSIIRTIELAISHVQLSSDIMEYLPEVTSYAAKVKSERQAENVIKLYHLYVSKFTVDYHSAVCNEIQNILPIVCGFYGLKINTEYKNLLFEAFYISLYAIYPFLKNGEINNISIVLKADWSMILKKIKCIIENEIRELKAMKNIKNINELDTFIKLAAAVHYITLLDKAPNHSLENRDGNDLTKKAKSNLDLVESLIQLSCQETSQINEIWFAITAEVISNYNVLTLSNFKCVLDTISNICEVHLNGSIIKYLRICIESVLRYEVKNIDSQHYKNYWETIFKALSSDYSTLYDIIYEKHLIYHICIRYGKISYSNCTILIQNIVSNSALKRTECLNTIKQILLHSQEIGLDKSGTTIVPILNWIYDINTTINIVQNVIPVDSDLIAETAAIAVINFHNAFQTDSYKSQNNLLEKTAIITKNISYKYNIKLLPIEKNISNESFCLNNIENSDMNCLFQSNYEVLMRLTNYDTTKATSCKDMISDLISLSKLICLLNYFIEFNIFSIETYSNCPLVKRIGLFLSHLELQFRSNDPGSISFSNSLEILNAVLQIVQSFLKNDTLLSYLDQQPLDEMLNFIGSTLQRGVSFDSIHECDTGPNITVISFEIFAHLCATDGHFKESFKYIKSFKLNSSKDFNLILKVIEIICLQKTSKSDLAVWIVEHLKTIFKLYYTNVNIICGIITLLPGILKYVHEYDEPLQNMLQALISLLKIAKKKSYSTELTSQIISSIEKTLFCCKEIYRNENYLNVCLSATKFLHVPSLDIQYAAVRLILSLMDWQIVKNPAEELDLHFDICEKLYLTFDFKSTSTWDRYDSNVDLIQNGKSVAIQLLLGVFMFGSYHKRHVLEDLTYLCAARRISERDFGALQEIPGFFKCDFSNLINSYIEELIHYWITTKNSIFKFPSFLCWPVRTDILQSNMHIICPYLSIYDQNDDLMKLLDKESSKYDIKESLPFITAISVIFHCNCEEANRPEFTQRFNTMANSLLPFGIDIMTTKTFIDQLNWRVILNIIKFLHDDIHFHNWFPKEYRICEKRWFSISFSSMEKCLSYIDNKFIQSNGGEVFRNTLVKNPVDLVYLLNEIKIMYITKHFDFDRFKYLYLYYTAADLILNSFPLRDDPLQSSLYFVREVLFFALNVVIQENHWPNQYLSMKFIKAAFLQKAMYSGCGIQVLKTYFYEISSSLSDIIVKNQSVDIKNMAFGILNELFTEKYDNFKEVIANIDEFTHNQIFTSLNKFINSNLSGKEDLGIICKNFMEINTRRFEGFVALRKNLAKFKKQLCENRIETNETVKFLLNTIRTSKNIKASKEAIKCLGEIGSLKNKYHLFYLPCFRSAEELETSPQDYFAKFILSILNILDKHLLAVKAERQSPLIDVIMFCINSLKEDDNIELYPYLYVFRCANHKYEIPIYKDIKTADLNQLIKQMKTYTYDKWLQHLMSFMFRNFGWSALERLTFVDIEFSEASFNSFIQYLLSSNKKIYLELLLNIVNFFFWEFIKCYDEKTSGVVIVDSIYMEKRAVIKMLYISDCLRVNNNWDLPLNLLHMSIACNYCQAYFMSIMYLEMWGSFVLTVDQTMDKNKLMSNKQFQKCATEAYKAVGCYDALLGFLNPLDSRIEILNLENNWNDILLEAESSKIEESLLHSSLEKNGMYCLSNSLQTKVNHELCWRLGNWDDVVEVSSKINSLTDMENRFQAYHYNALKCLFHKEENNVIISLQNARDCIFEILREISLECLQSINKYMTWLYIIQQVEDFCEIQFTSGSNSKAICEKFQLTLDMDFSNFFFKETIVFHQITLFKVAGVRAKRKLLEYYKTDPVKLCLINCIDESKCAGELSVAKRHIAFLRSFDDNDEHVKLKVLLEDAEILLETGQQHIAKLILQNILTTSNYIYCLERVRALHLYGKFIMETNTEPFSVVAEKYFLKSITLFEKVREKVLSKYPSRYNPESIKHLEEENKKCAYELIAKYADKEYMQLNSYINSPEFQMRNTIIKENREAAESVGKQQGNRDKLVGAINLKKFANLDENELHNLEQRRTDNLCFAIEHYIRYSAIDDNLSSCVIYRIIALWFANKQNSSLHKAIVEHINTVPDYKFICALSQMTARLNSQCTDFVDVIKNVLIRCTAHHPHHSLYQLYSLIFAHVDAPCGNSNDSNRAEIAKEIISKARSKENAMCIKQMESLFSALIDFANVPTPDKKSASIPLNDKVKRLKNLDAIQCPTIFLPVSPNQTYKLTNIIKWDSRASMVGGINAPKKLICQCSDGIARPQLLKGKDDLRQDAVMQQVFSLINELLRNDRKSAEKNLLLRTYKVVPLSMRSGILEWCENTIPFGVYLSGDGKKGAHKKYRPNDYTNVKCRQLSMTHLKSGFEKRYQIYNHICENVKPVFRYFFYENYLVPGVWFERRLAYTQSVATTSIIGYVLGLGDRHTQNILLDKKSGEVIHIDFGIAFEQGKIMPTPETVPFRLTRDVVDPMGICGTDGTFQKACEVTMNVLRLNHSSITTILEVLLYDPLYIWKVVSSSNIESDAKNLTAQRALYVIRDKLEGKQAGLLGSSTAEVHVQRLINEALSTRNLCQLYPGWDPYL